MTRSHVIEVDGRFVGVAVLHSAGYRIVAVHPSLKAIDGSIWQTLGDAQRVARRAVRGLDGPSSCRRRLDLAA